MQGVFQNHLPRVRRSLPRPSGAVHFLADAFSRVVHQAADGRDISEENLRSIASFCRYAFIGFVMQFFWNGMENDIDESVDRLGTLFDSFLHGALQTAE